MVFKNLDIPEHDARWAEAVKIHKKGDRAAALYLFRRLAQEGCAPALLEIGKIYEVGGGGVKQDLSTAIEWYLYSVETVDDVRAHLALGRVYLKADRSNKKYNNAFYHLNLVVEHDSRMGALFGLGLVYEYGIEVEKDFCEAERLYSLATEKGHLMSQMHLARIKFHRSKLLGVFMWLSAVIKILPTAIRNSNDIRLTIA